MCFFKILSSESGQVKKKIHAVVVLLSLCIVGITVVLFYSITIPTALGSENQRTYSTTSFADTNCLEYETTSWKMNDSVHHYLEQSYLNGMGVLKYAREIQPKLDSGKLEVIENNSNYILDTMYYSYPFLTPKSIQLLNSIGDKFQEKLKNTHFKNVRFVITSALRTVSSINRLRKRNKNAIRHSAHLHGTSFDISYDEFDAPFSLSMAEILYLKEALAQSLFELRENNRCWVTYEQWQTCFHVVAN